MSQSQANPLRTCKLIMVTGENNNKFYEMRDNSEETFTVTYGRVGTSGTSREFSSDLWDKKYNEKVRKGYKDQTSLFAKEKSRQELNVDNLEVKSLLESLLDYSKKSIAYHYSVSADNVTAFQLKEAQGKLDALKLLFSEEYDHNTFNDLLLSLYQVIPRRMSNVKEYLINDLTSRQDVLELLSAEQETLDILSTQVSHQVQEDEEEAYDILTSMGIGIEVVENPRELRTITKMMGGDKGLLNKVYRIVNNQTQSQFNEHLENQSNVKTKLFWHGSRNENWLSILETGLVLRPSSAVINGKMFGYGLYFADKFQKSLNYSSLRGSYWAFGNSDRGFLAIYEVHTGKPLKVKNHEPWCGQLDYTVLRQKGNYDSLYAKRGVDLINNEFIIYKEQQCTIKYLVEVKR